MIDVAQRVMAGAMAAALSGVSGAAFPSAPRPNAEGIFSRVRDAASSQRCPARLEYVIGVAAEINGRVEQKHFRATYLFDLDYLHVAALSEEESSGPRMYRAA